MPDLISVVMPVYNCEKQLEQSLNSLLSQTYRTFELIIINDGSTDDSYQVVINFISDNPSINVKVVNNKTNRGESASRNIGIDLAAGRFLSFLDADDEYHPDFLRLMHKKISQNFDFVYCGFDTYTLESKIIRFEEKRKYLQSSEQIIKQYLNAQNHFSHVASIYSIQFIQTHKLRYNENYSYGVDVEFICNLLLSGPVCSTVPQSLYKYKMRAGSMSTSLTHKAITDCLVALEQVQSRIPSLQQRWHFMFTRKANMALHLIEQIYKQKINEFPSISYRFNLSLLASADILINPKKNLQLRKLKAVFFFLILIR